MKPGIVLEGGIETFKVGEPAPELMKKIGPLLCAAGTEELRIRNVHRQAPRADPARYAERVIRLDEFIHGREVFLSTVNIRLNIETNEILMINVNFLPDHGIDHLPRLSPGQAKTRAAAGMSQSAYEQWGLQDRTFRFSDTPSYLAYEIEQFGFAPVRGVLVWVFSAQDDDSHEWYEVNVDASTGRIVRIWTSWIN